MGGLLFVFLWGFVVWVVEVIGIGGGLVGLCGGGWLGGVLGVGCVFLFVCVFVVVGGGGVCCWCLGCLCWWVLGYGVGS